jgi:hypothetical protein
VCGFCIRTDIVREHLEENLRICDVSAKGLYVVIAKNIYRGGQKTKKLCWTYTRATEKEDLS